MRRSAARHVLQVQAPAPAPAGVALAPALVSQVEPLETPSDLRALVSQLWQDAPPTVVAGRGGPLPAAALQESLARVSLRAETVAALAGGAARDPGALLAQAARSLHAMLDLVAAERHDVLLRVARLERWLTLRAQSEPAAGCAADLALWVLEHLEGAAGE